MKEKIKQQITTFERARDKPDISLIRLNLSLSYEQRIEKHEDARELLEELRAAGVRANEKPRKAS